MRERGSFSNVNPPVTAVATISVPVSITVPDGLASAFASSSGGIGNLTSSIGSTPSAGVYPSGIATASIGFRVDAPVEVNVGCSGSPSMFTTSIASFTGSSEGNLLRCTFDTHFGTFLLNPTDTYTISTFTQAQDIDGAFASIGLGGDFIVFTPEPSTFWRLGLALISLGLVRNRLEKGKERQAIR
jgi:hypothetical protein